MTSSQQDDRPGILGANLTPLEASSPLADSPCREHFIPLRKAELVRLLVHDETLHNGSPDRFEQLCHLLAATIHHQYYTCLDDLKGRYAPFNPDCVTTELRILTDDERRRMVPALFDSFTQLLQRANYRRLSRQELDQAIGVASDWGVHLHVDFKVFDRLEVYVRGDVTQRRSRRCVRSYYREQFVDVPLYQRLVVMFCLRAGKDTQEGVSRTPVRIKIFKNIPKADLDMLLPGTRFAMTLLDRGKIILPTLTGLAIAIMKIVKGALLLAFAGIYGILAVLGLIGGTLGYGVKSFFGYLRTKEKYQLNLTRSLYYQNLDNNAGVIFRVLDEAEEQEFQETVLAYALLYSKAGQEGWTGDELDREAESYLSRILPCDVDFEVHDALAKLERFGCAVRTDQDRWRATPIQDALRRLDEAWDNCFRYHEHHATCLEADPIDRTPPSSPETGAQTP